MAQPLIAESSAALIETLAEQMGCEPEDYDSNDLTICMRPGDSHERSLVLATTCGTGSVLSVRDKRLGEWAQHQVVEPHYRIFLPSFLEGLAAYAREIGYADAKSHSATTGMVIDTLVHQPKLRPPYTIRRLRLEEQEELRATRKFDNALGEPDETHKISMMRRAFCVELGEGGEIVGVAGIWEQYPDTDEIGVDVLRDHRGYRLGHALTVHATRWVLSARRWPIYTYGVTNIRSANNGIAAGYRPLWTLAAVYVPEDMA